MSETATRCDDECPNCRCDMGWVDCPECGGEGAVSRYDEDPLWYGEDDLFTCELCMGKGGWRRCYECHPGGDRTDDSVAL